MHASTKITAARRPCIAGDAIAGTAPPRPPLRKQTALLRQLHTAVRREPNTAAGVLAFWCKGSN